MAYEQGERLPSADALAALSQILEFPPEFFFGPVAERLEGHGVSFRSMSRTAATRREQALAAGEMALILIDYVEAEFELPKPHVPDLHPQPTAELAARSIRTLWGLADKPVANMVRLLEAHGVRVLSLAENTRDIDAFSFWRHGKPFVFLNTLKSPERSRFDAAHELGHLVMHQHGHPSGREAETEANAFASAFLMPESSIRRYAPARPLLRDLVYAKKGWGVSVAALAHRMHRLQLLSDWQYQSLCIDIQKHGYREEEPDPIPRELSQIWPSVFSTLKDDGLTRAKLATKLGWPLDELRGLIFQLVLSADPGNGGSGAPVVQHTALTQQPAHAQKPLRQLRLER